MGQFITATATSASTLDTSELSNSLEVSNPFVVTTTADNPFTPVVGSLRQVIMAVNANPPVGGTTDPITFSIPTTDPGYQKNTGVWTISLTAALPPITVPVTLDATTQGTSTAGPLVQIDGTVNGNVVSGDGLVLGSTNSSGSAGSTIKGVDIVGFAGVGIHIETANDLIVNDVLGTNPGGSAAGPGNAVGVLIENTRGNTIGGSSAGADVIGSNSSAGVLIIGTAATGNLVANDFIGTNSTGAVVGNSVGILIDSGASGNTIGGSTANANVIAASGTAGVLISGVSSLGNVIAGNFIGTDSSNRNLGNAAGVAILGTRATLSVERWLRPPMSSGSIPPPVCRSLDRRLKAT